MIARSEISTKKWRKLSVCNTPKRVNRQFIPFLGKLLSALHINEKIWLIKMIRIIENIYICWKIFIWRIIFVLSSKSAFHFFKNLQIIEYKSTQPLIDWHPCEKDVPDLLWCRGCWRQDGAICGAVPAGIARRGPTARLTTWIWRRSQRSGRSNLHETAPPFVKRRNVSAWSIIHIWRLIPWKGQIWADKGTDRQTEKV